MKTKAQTKQIRWWDFPAAALLIAALTSVALRLSATNWTEYLYITGTIVILSSIIGLALGFSRFSPWISGLIGFLYAICVIPWQLTITEPKINAGMLWSERLIIVRFRLITVVDQLINQQAVNDSILFIFLMSLLFWVLGLISGYNLTRRGEAWLSLLPAGIVLVFFQSYDPLDLGKVWYLAAYIFFGLILVARVAYLHNCNRWQNNQTALPPYLGLDFIRFTLFTVGTIVILAWTFPALATSLPSVNKLMRPIRQTWTEVQENFDNAFASLKSTLNVPTDYYGSSLRLGQGNALSDQVMFWVKPSSVVPKEVRLYWRARTYHIYDGFQWQSLNSNSSNWNSDTEIVFPKENGKWNSKFTINSSSYFTTLLSPATPIWTDRNGQVTYLENPDKTIDLFAFQAEPLVRPGQNYQVEAEVSNPTIFDLKNSGQDYPDWIKDRYLQLPETITNRTIELTDEITVGLDNPYDKTTAIINFLRDDNNFQYQEIITPPPPNRDVVDWFLFENRTGFCNYFASAAVVMLRLEGIPSRLAVGYATGEKKDGQYMVRQKQAHAWPEVYFSGLGWIEFEPTTSQLPISRLPGGETTSSGEDSSSDAIPFRPPPALLDDERWFDQNSNKDLESQTPLLSTAQIILISLLLLLSISFLIIFFLKSRNIINIQPFPVLIMSSMIKLGFRPPTSIQKWAEISSLNPLAKSYLEINRALIRLGRQLPNNSTPAERAKELSVVLPQADSSIKVLLNEYQIGIFSNKVPNISIASQAGSEIRNISVRVFFNKTWESFKSLQLLRKSRKK